MEDLHIINGPENDYRGPAAGLGTEHGDSWKAAVEKINANFQRVMALAEGGGVDIASLVERIASAVRADMQKALDSTHERIAALEAGRLPVELQVGSTGVTISDPAHSMHAPAAEPVKIDALSTDTPQASHADEVIDLDEAPQS